MALVPLSYNARSLAVRWGSTMLTVVSIGATVAVVAGVLALEQGFSTLFSSSGREDVAVLLRPGATNEGMSGITREKAEVMIKTLGEFAADEQGRPLAAAEMYLAVRMRKLDGGETNVPIRGVQPMSFEIAGDGLRIREGRRFRQGTDEIIVSDRLSRRIRGCVLGEVIRVNTTPFEVVGVFEADGPFGSEIWGDVDRVADALNRSVFNRVVGIVGEGVDIDEFAERLEDHDTVPALVQSERAYLAAQTRSLSTILNVLGGFLAVIMGIAAVFTATNTMQAALAARSHEIGILLSLGFRPLPVFCSFMLEALLLGLLGGVAGVLIALPLNGIETGATNFDSFTEVAFAFRLTPRVLASAVVFALGLGLCGGALPAWRAARLDPVTALRRH
ncbi:MAG: ABC transporter permease [Planctomycetota bacterium]|jgi:putative ABC transport system permease protein|nr:ABC transporter permease [Planctomycetota bacterium]MDP6988502.1 ABC transporter permease [Planctomycetota bacterium]